MALTENDYYSGRNQKSPDYRNIEMDMCDPHFHLLNMPKKVPTGIIEQWSEKLSEGTDADDKGRLPDTWLRASGGGEEIALGAHDRETVSTGCASSGVLDRLEYKHEHRCADP